MPDAALTPAPLRYDVNLSILFTELPLLQRPAAAAAAGFDAVELWWPFPDPVPADRELDALRTALTDAGTRLVGLNFDAGDMAAGSRGLLSRPADSARFRANVDVAVGFAGSLDCTVLNALYGNRDPDVSVPVQRELATENLVFAALAAERVGATVVIEALNSFESPRYPITSSQKALDLIDYLKVVHGVPNVAFLADLYHLARMGEPVERLVELRSDRFGHVQIADPPGRGQPGTGELDWDAVLGGLAASGYRGHVGLEYKPVGPSADSFGWLPRHLRATATVEERCERASASDPMSQQPREAPAERQRGRAMSTIGFIGLGIMGGPMAANLLTAGHTVIGYDTQPAAAERLVAAGGKAVDSVAAATAADVVITMLPDSPHVEDVVLGPGGVLEHAEPGLLLIDMSTIRPDTSVAIAAAAAGRGVRALDAPVSGGEKGAIDGVLSIMVGGEAEAFAAAKPVLEVLGQTIVHVGPSGAGQTVKAANQLVVGGIYALVAEAIVLLEASGVDPGAGLDVLAGGLAGSRILELKRESMVARQFAPGFRIDLHHKDMGIALAAAREAGVALPVTGLVAQLVAAARAQGYGSLDHSVLLKVLENVSGRAAT